MLKKDLASCEYLFPDKQNYSNGVRSGKYTEYMCSIDSTKCLWARIRPLRFWKMRDDLDLEKVKKCSKREEFNKGFY